MGILNIQSLRVGLYQTADQYFSLGFPRYQPQKDRILYALALLLTEENVHHALFPKRPLLKGELPSVKDRIKSKEVDLVELRERGVFPSFTLVKPASDNRGGGDPYNVYLHASLYVLPAGWAFARQATYQPERYQELKPHVNASLLCAPSAGTRGYYLEVGALNFGGAMAVKTEDPNETIGHFHLVKECRDAQGVTHQTENIFHLDGMKIFLPFEVVENGTRVAKTLVLSAAITVLGGATAWSLDQLSRHQKSFPQDNAFTYGLGGLSEIWMVIEASQRQNPTTGWSLQNN